MGTFVCCLLNIWLSVRLLSAILTIYRMKRNGTFSNKKDKINDFNYGPSDTQFKTYFIVWFYFKIHRTHQILYLLRFLSFSFSLCQQKNRKVFCFDFKFVQNYIDWHWTTVKYCIKCRVLFCKIEKFLFVICCLLVFLFLPEIVL